MESETLSCFIFAYGSNMCRERIVDRVPSAVSVGVGRLTHHRFLFHKRGLDGSAKADALLTGNERDEVWGVVLRIDEMHKPDLDRFESLGVGYDCVVADIELVRGELQSAWTYRALPDAIEEGLSPFFWYRQFVVQGARQHGLPEEYLEFLEAFDSIRDPDGDRRRANELLLR